MIRKLFAPEMDSPATGLALLVLRVWLGFAMLPHGFGKLKGFGETSGGFPDPLGVGGAVSLALAVFAEFFCALLLVAGLLTRIAALMLVITMSVAFFVVHQGALTGERSGELAFIYLAGYVTLLIAGPGRLSLDGRFFKRGEGSAA